jgi:2-C-methyl-D-erythritol 4-phosphate cytidylyltransferase
MSRVAVILPAAGASSRFGGPYKKPFVPLAGRPVWLRSAELFARRPDVAMLFVVVAPAECDAFAEVLAAERFPVPARVVAGGAERFESVANALARVPAEVELVAVHDAVRPLTPPAVIDAVFAAAFEYGAALAAVPMADTLKRASGDVVAETVPRAGLWAAQTPQAARRDWLVEAYARRHTLGVPITDDAQLLEACGFPVRLVPGSAVNFKITTRDDLALAEAVLATG